MGLGLSKRQVVLQYGLNAKTVDDLILRGVLRVLPGSTPLRPQLDPVCLSNLTEGAHLVRCLECRALQAAITSKHLKACSGLSLEAYVARHVDAKLSSASTDDNRAKSPEQCQAQSNKLKARFQTSAGDATRIQISEAATRMQAGVYGVRSANHLRALNQLPEQKELRRLLIMGRMARGFNPAKDWHAANPERSQAMAAHARRYITRKATKLHQRFKQALIDAGLDGFQTEHEVGYHAIDEALPHLRLAVEVDGCYWHSCQACGFSGPPGTLAHDRSKATFLRNRGWTLLRVPEHDINRDLGACVERVRQAVITLEASHVGCPDPT